MKATKVTRPLDKLYRVVIPRELARSYNLGVGDRLEFFTEADMIIMRKYNKGCALCGGHDQLIEFGGKHVCGHCRDDIRKMLQT